MNQTLALVFALLFAIVSLAVNGEEESKTTKLPAVSERLGVQYPSAPFKNHWDSNSWEAGSSLDFWHSREVQDSSRKATPAPTPPSQSKVWTRKPLVVPVR